jgi:hypothetical protein
MKTPILAAAAVAVLALTACAKTVEAPSQAGLCYLMSPQKDGTVKFNSIAHDIKDLEHCALELELARRRLKGLGSTRDEWIGAYQGSFIFVEREGIFTSTKLDGIRYPALVRFQNELVMPGAIVDTPEQAAAAAKAANATAAK